MEVRFNKNIYKKRAVSQAIKEFGDLGSFKISDTKQYFIVQISNIDIDTKDVLGDEFKNYVLYLMKK